MGRDDGVGTQTGANGTPGTAEERLQRGNGKREDRTKKGTQTGANGSPRGVDDRHEGDLRIIHCDVNEQRVEDATVKWKRQWVAGISI